MKGYKPFPAAVWTRVPIRSCLNEQWGWKALSSRCHPWCDVVISLYLLLMVTGQSWTKLTSLCSVMFDLPDNNAFWIYRWCADYVWECLRINVRMWNSIQPISGLQCFHAVVSYWTLVRCLISLFGEDDCTYCINGPQLCIFLLYCIQNI